jgi:hypothetical protein
MKHALFPMLVALAVCSCDKTVPESSQQPVESAETRPTLEAPDAPQDAPNVATVPAAVPPPPKVPPAEPESTPEPAPIGQPPSLGTYFDATEIGEIQSYRDQFGGATDAAVRDTYLRALELERRILRAGPGGGSGWGYLKAEAFEKEGCTLQIPGLIATSL